MTTPFNKVQLAKLKLFSSPRKNMIYTGKKVKLIKKTICNYLLVEVYEYKGDMMNQNRMTFLTVTFFYFG